MDKSAIINSIKKSYQSVRGANFHPTGVLATRVLVLTMLVPILLVVVEYIRVFIQGSYFYPISINCISWFPCTMD